MEFVPYFKFTGITNDYGKSNSNNRTYYFIVLYYAWRLGNLLLLTGITKVKNHYIDQQHHDSIDSRQNNHYTVLQC